MDLSTGSGTVTSRGVIFTADGRHHPDAPQQVDRGGPAGPRRRRPGRGPGRGPGAGARRDQGRLLRHFADRGALLEEMLDSWERKATDEVLERVERKGGDVRARLRRAGALTFSGELLPIDLAIRDWARRDQAVAERLRRVDNRRMEYLRLLFGALCPDEGEVEARSVLAFSLVIGHHFMAADHGARSHADVLELAARWLLT